MPPTLRKRKSQGPPEPASDAKKHKGNVISKAPAKVKETVKAAAATPSKKTARKTKKEPETVAEEEPEPVAEEEPATEPEPKVKAETKKSTPGKPQKGEQITLEGFGGEIQTNDGKTTTLKQLVDESQNGVVLFTYPKASTPGCTTQVCLFRDAYESITAGGLAVYGLSADSIKANTTFKTKQELPYTLLCDPAATLISAIGLKKSPKGTQRGVFVVDKEGKVLAAEAGGPAATLAVVKKLESE